MVLDDVLVLTESHYCNLFLDLFKVPLNLQSDDTNCVIILLVFMITSFVHFAHTAFANLMQKFIESSWLIFNEFYLLELALELARTQKLSLILTLVNFITITCYHVHHWVHVFIELGNNRRISTIILHHIFFCEMTYVPEKLSRFLSLFFLLLHHRFYKLMLSLIYLLVALLALDNKLYDLLWEFVLRTNFCWQVASCYSLSLIHVKGQVIFIVPLLRNSF